MKAYVDRSSLRHFLALASLARVRGGSVVERIHEGAEFWRRLRKWEARGDRLALRLCNGPQIEEAAVMAEEGRIRAGVLSVLGRSSLPRGLRLRVNLDPRGYSLKLVGNLPGAVRDWGGDCILAPEFGGRS